MSIFPNGFKNSGLNKFGGLGLRLVDKFTTGGAVFNVVDDNGTAEGKFNYKKYIKDFIVWIPFILMFCQVMGWLTPEQTELLNESAPN